MDFIFKQSAFWLILPLHFAQNQLPMKSILLLLLLAFCLAAPPSQAQTMTIQTQCDGKMLFTFQHPTSVQAIRLTAFNGALASMNVTLVADPSGTTVYLCPDSFTTASQYTFRCATYSVLPIVAYNYTSVGQIVLAEQCGIGCPAWRYAWTYDSNGGWYPASFFPCPTASPSPGNGNNGQGGGKGRGPK